MCYVPEQLIDATNWGTDSEQMYRTIVDIISMAAGDILGTYANRVSNLTLEVKRALNIARIPYSEAQQVLKRGDLDEY